MGELQEDQIDLSKVVSAVRRRFLVVVATAIAVCLGTLLYVWISKPIWEAKAVLLVPQDDFGGGGGGGNSAVLGLLAEKAQSTDVLRGVLISHTAQETLRSLTKMKPKDFEKAYQVDSDPTTNEITIAFRDNNHDETQQVVQRAIDELDKLNRTVGFSRAGRQADEYQKALDVQQQQLTQAEDDLVSYQQQAKTTVDGQNALTAPGGYIKAYRTLQQEYAAADLKLKTLEKQVGTQLEPEVKVPIGTPRFAEVRNRLTEAELDLRLKMATYQEDSPEVRDAREKLAQVRKDLQVEISRYIASVRSGTSDEALQLLSNKIVLGYQMEQAKQVADVAPGEAQKFYTLINRVELIYRQVSEISAQLSIARIQASVDKIRYSVLDQPYVGDRPTNKNYLVYGIVALAGGAVLGMIVAYWLDSRDRKKAKQAAGAHA